MRFKKSEKREMILAAFLISLFLGGIALQTIPYTGSWELSATIYSVRENGVWYDLENQPYIVEQWGSNIVHFDTDEHIDDYGYDHGLAGADYTGTADTIVSMGGVYHMSFDGETWNRDNTDFPYKTVNKWFDTNGDNINDAFIKYDWHVYAFDVDISTQCDRSPDGIDSKIEARGKQGTPSKILTRVAFSIDKWTIPLTYEYGGQTYERDSGNQAFFAGIMSTSVLKADAYKHSDVIDNGYLIANYLSIGTKPNMWLDDDVGYSAKDTTYWDTIQDVPTSILIDLPVDLEAGYAQEWFLFIPTGAPVSSDVGLLYTVRVDVITSAGYHLVSGDADEKEENTDEDTQPTWWDNVIAWWVGAYDAWKEEFGNAAPWVQQLILAVIVILVLYVAAKGITIYGVTRQKQGLRGRK